MSCSSRRIADILSADTPLGTTANCASITQWKPFSVVILKSFGTVPSTRGLQSQPVVLATIQTLPEPRFFIVLPVPDSYGAVYLPSSARKAQVFSQPLVGSLGSLSPRM